MKKFFLFFILFPALLWSKSRFWDENFQVLEAPLWQNLEQVDLIDGFLIASLITNRESVVFYANQVKTFLADFRSQPYTNNAERAERLLLKLHERFLKRYRETANTLSTVLQTGEFNCMSSSILYSLCVRALDIPVRLNLYTTHVRPEVQINGQWIEVEATSPFGYNIRQKVQVQQDFIRLTSFSNETTPLAVVSQLRQWYAVWYANEVYMQVRRRNISNAFQFAIRALELDTNIAFVLTNGVAAYQEYATFLNNRGYTSESLQVLEEGISLFPGHKVLENNYQAYIFQMIMKTLKEGKLTDARKMIQQYQRILLTNEDIVGSVYQELLYRLIKISAYEEAWNTLRSIEKDFGEKKWFTKVSAYGMISLVKKLVDEWKGYPQHENLVLAWYQSLTLSEKDAYLTEYYNNIGLFYKQAGFSQKALDIWLKGLQYVKTSQVIRKNVASWYISQANEATSSRDKITLYKNALEYDKDNWEIERAILISYRNLIEEYSNKEDWKSVLLYAEEALVLYPSDKQLQYHRDYAKRKLGK